MINEDGFRLNVGIMLLNKSKQVFWARRVKNKNAWQFPQGGVKEGETLEQAMFRELNEELGLSALDVKILSVSNQWLSYRLPKRYWRKNSLPLVIGQKQKWFLLEMISDDSQIQLDSVLPAEFDQWRWVDYHYPLNNVIDFKKEVYKSAICEFESIVFQHE